MSGKAQSKAFHTGFGDARQQTGLLSPGLQVFIGAKDKLAHRIAELCDVYSCLRRRTYIRRKIIRTYIRRKISALQNLLFKIDK